MILVVGVIAYGFSVLLFGLGVFLLDLLTRGSGVCFLWGFVVFVALTIHFNKNTIDIRASVRFQTLKKIHKISIKFILRFLLS